MPQRIFKYDLEVESRQLIQMPKGAKILSVAEQRERPVLFALVDGNEKEFEHRVFRIVTTGEDFNANSQQEFIGTIIIKDWYTAHVFEQTVSGGLPDPVSDRFKEDQAQLRKELIDAIE